jgi:hypothetical protein
MEETMREAIRALTGLLLALALSLSAVAGVRHADAAAGSATDLAAETATHREVEPLGIEFKTLTALRLDGRGNLLACDGGAKQIKVIDSSGEQVRTIELDFAPEALDVGPDGTLYCGGEGRLARLDGEGRTLKIVDFQPAGDAAEAQRRRARTRRPRISGIAVSEADLYVACGTGWSLSSKSDVFRFDPDLENGSAIVEGLRGCCQRCDIAARGGKLYVAENSVHRVLVYDREGRLLDKWGARSRTDLAGFGACCNPMNLCFGADGALYTAESGLGRVKRYTADGEMLDLVGYVATRRFTRAGGLAASCSNIAIAVRPGAERLYVMDYKGRRIRVLQRKG